MTGSSQTKASTQAKNPQDYLATTAFVDADHPKVQAFAHKHVVGKSSDVDRAVALYYAVRDGFRYDPYRIELSVAGLRASSVLEKGYGWCVTKAVLLAAACRVVGIPASLGFADVKNHLSSERLRQAMGTDVFYYHGYCAIWLNNRWVKATPAFNIELCEKSDLRPLEFNGLEDSIYHAFDEAGNRHMEYLNFRGEYADVPLEEMKATLHEHYPTLKLNSEKIGAGDFEAEVSAEHAASQK